MCNLYNVFCLVEINKLPMMLREYDVSVLSKNTTKMSASLYNINQN